MPQAQTMTLTKEERKMKKEKRRNLSTAKRCYLANVAVREPQ